MKNKGKSMKNGFKKDTDWSVGALMIALGSLLLILWEATATPTFTFSNHVFSVTQGIAIMAILMGGLFWSIIEVFTPSGKGWIDLIIRPAIGFFVGGIVGGFMGYEFNFGAYILLPARNGNTGALFELIAIIFAFMVFVVNASWSHNKSFTRKTGGISKGKSRKNRMAAIAPFAASSSISGSAIFSSIWDLFLGFIKSMETIFASSIGNIMTGFVSGIDVMFQSWGYSLATYGIWGPLFTVISLGLAGFVLYLFLGADGAEKDVISSEEEI